MITTRRIPSGTSSVLCDSVAEPADCAAGGDPEDWRRQQLAAVYRAQAPGLARYFRTRFRGTEDPDDLVHEVFARLASVKSFGDLRDPQAYLSRILRNFLIDRKRRLDKRPSFVGLEGVEPAVPPDQSHQIELTQMRERYRAAVDALPPRTRQVFLLHRVEDQSVKVIAAELGISSRTVEWHLAQAIMRIGEALDRE
jgi:RNA polymerase sigma factor (sigma-70 family)